LTTLNVLPIHWEPFLQSISGRAYLPGFDHLWIDYTQKKPNLYLEECKTPHDENQALSFHTKKGRRNRRSFNKAIKDKKTSSASGHEHKKDNSRIQCFRCDKYGHIERNCPTRKKGRQLASTTDVDPEPHQRDEDIKDESFFFISTLSGIIPTDSDIWLIDSGSSRHMTGHRDHL
jgi:hypothetical protein